MSETIDPVRVPQQSVTSRFFSHLLVMPRWHKSVLTLALLIGGAGLAGHVMRFASPPKHQTTASTVSGSKIVSDSAPDPSAASDDSSQQSWLAAHAPMLTRTGIGCIAGFIIGWLFRAFLKLMSMLTLAGVALFGALSYFHIMNVDFTEAKEKYDSSIAWVSGQAGKLKDAASAHVPASGSSIFGMFLGFRRKN